MLPPQLMHVAPFQNPIGATRYADAVENISLTMPQIDPTEGSFVQTQQRRLMKLTRIRAEGAPPASVSHGCLIGRRNAIGKQLFGGRLKHAIDDPAEPANARHKVQTASPVTPGRIPLVFQNFLDDHGQLVRVVGA